MKIPLLSLKKKIPVLNVDGTENQDGDDADRLLCAEKTTQMTGVRSQTVRVALRVRVWDLRVFYRQAWRKEG